MNILKFRMYFVSAKIILRVEEDAITLPEAAVQPGQDGPFVFVVKEGRARAQNVTVDRQLGQQVVVTKGLQGNEQVVIEVPPTLTNGSQVTLAGEGGSKGGKGGKGKATDGEAAKAPEEGKAEAGKAAGGKAEGVIKADQSDKAAEGGKGKKGGKAKADASAN